MDYSELVHLQREYFKSGATLCVEGRKKVLQRVLDMLGENKQLLSDAIYKDLHRDGILEVEKTMEEAALGIKKLDEWVKPTPFTIAEDRFTVGEDELFIVPEPLGVVLVISPWNYPCICSAPFISALTAGNTVILKPSEIGEHFADAIHSIAEKYLDKKIFAVVKGGIPETTELLKQHFDHICYTGNPQVARVIMSAAAKNLTPVTLELGGKNPVLIAESADLTDAAKKIVIGKVANCGQICLAPDYIITTPKMKQALVTELVKAVEEYGDLKSNPENARIVNQRHFDRIGALVEKSQGKLLYKYDGEADREDKFFPPQILEVNQGDLLLKEEIFGPVLPILEVNSFDEAIRYIQDHDKPLGAYVFTKCECEAEKFIKHTSSGGVSVNDVMIHGSTRLMPFGGVGNSGMGRIKCEWGFKTFTHEKPVVVRNKLGPQVKKLVGFEN
ncbi:unnamed protein product, partial [Mesorhabditis belari]|uniref:Aldehyde dehydrogenase n=1 Tax=Mesorhabditis belari TaxID=2138241 RepID=A0AAF3EEH0_9BILA